MIQSWLDQMFNLEAIEHHIYPDSCGMVFLLISGYPAVPEGRGNRSELSLFLGRFSPIPEGYSIVKLL